MTDNILTIVVCTIVSITIFILIGGAYTILKATHAPCEELGYMSTKNLPARCLEFYK